MFKFLIVLTTLVYYTYALGAVPLELSNRFSEITSRKEPSTSVHYRVPSDTVPFRYDVHITTNIHEKDFNFNGRVEIYLKATKEDVDRITIHHRNLTIGNIVLNECDLDETGGIIIGADVAVGSNTYDETTEFLTIPLSDDKTLVIDQFYKLVIDYTGKLRGRKNDDEDAGFYASSYKDDAGVEKWLATTQFESTDARHGFPCYDEPALKAVFNIKLTHSADYNAISNMPGTISEDDPQTTTTTFEETPIMSTYLIAFVVSDFKYVANLHEPVTDETKILHRVFGTPGRQDELNVTLEAGVKILQELEDYLGVKYDLPKMDQIGIPDFAAGAMENWGLVTYTESAFYYTTDSPLNQEDRITKIVAHEFAHQWFGNLVSPEWWNYIWLNEGFATVFEYLIPNILYPQYKALDYFRVHACHRVLVTDSVSDSRPMTFAAYTPREISSLFDRIAYDKSGCVITMIMHAIGETAFKAGLKEYLTDHSNAEGTPSRLFTALQDAASGTLPSTININTVFSEWSTQRGYPILQVNVDQITKAITLKQEAFLIDASSDEQNLIWTIPYNFITNEELDSEDTTPFNWLDKVSTTIAPGAERDWANANWVLFNKKSTGYYRVNYDPDNWNALISYMEKAEDVAKIHHLNKAELLGDAMNIARTGRLSYAIPLRLAQNMMKHETDYFTWIPFINDFNFLEQTLFNTTSYSKLLKFALEVGTAAYNHYTIEENLNGDSYYDTITRYNLVNFMCRVGYTKCHEDTNEALPKYLANDLVLSSYFKPAILQNSLRNGDSEYFLDKLNLAMDNAPIGARSSFIAGLGLTNSEENIQNLLGTVLTASNSKYGDITINYSDQERITILTTIASSKLSGFSRVLELLKTEEQTVKEIIDKNIVTVFSTLASRTSNTETLEKLKELMTLYEEMDVESRFAGYIETANKNILWNEEVGLNIKEALDSIYPDDPEVPGISNFILPQDTVPVRYDVHITTEIDQGKFDFTGNVKIYLQAMKDADRIVIHHRQLLIGTTRLIAVTEEANDFKEFGFSVPLKSLTYNATNEFLTIPLNDVQLTTGQYYKLEIDYKGTLRGRKAQPSNSDAGFYRSSYTENGVTKWLATTQFESTDARHGFPCYDEPALKAIFNIKLTHGTVYRAISNMPEQSRTTDKDQTTTTFEKTPFMSTYLIAFVVSDFQYVANLHEPVSDPTKILHRVYGTPGRQDQLNFTLEAGVKILDALSEYLDVNYIDTMPKMDQIAIPDFSAGAMENWGLVTYAESAFYYSETTSPRNQKDRIAKIVAHEFAHQWFGNLVSPEWWNYIWLNEGFATVFEFLIPNKVYPEYRALDYFTVQVCQRLMITDSRSTIRPMTFDAHTPNQISALFDSIAYDKSGCVLTMIMHAIGEPVFKAGLTQYLTDRNQKAANSNHLFSALNNAATTAGTIPSVINITSVFGRWSLQRGYPLLQVTFNKTTKEIKLGQEAFLSDLSTDPYELVWTIPYNFITNEELDAGNDNTTTYGWLDDVSKIVTRTAGRNWNTSDWVLFNIKSTGYYRVNYDSDNWNALISHMAIAEDAAKIHFINRAQLLGDAMNIARTNRLSYDIPLNLAKTMMKHETSYFTWTPFISDFNFLEQIMFEQTSYETLLKLAVEAGSTAFNHFTITDQDSDEFYYGTMTRYALINFMCRVGYTKCHEDTTAALIGYLEDATTLSSAYLKPVILQNSLRNADNELFIKVWTLIMQNTSHADRSTFMAGLGLSNSEENIQFLLDSVLVATNSEHSQVVINYSASERTTILTTIASSKLSGFKLVLELLKTEEVKIKAILSNNIGTVISTLASRTSNTETLEKLKELMTLYEEMDVESRFAGYIETANKNILWNEEVGLNIKEALDSIYPDDPEVPGISNFILPQDTVPVRYDVHITTEIDQGKFDFTGNVKIYLQAMKDADRIVIHHRQLLIGTTRLIAVTEEANDFKEFGFSVPLKSLTYNTTNEFLTIPLNDVQLTTGQYYKLEIDYKGTLRGRKAQPSNSDAGFYRSSYTENGVTKWLATTQFESTDARHGFPCYDEPALKAIFNIKLTHGTVYRAISNMPEQSRTTDKDQTTTTFEKTPFMSTYLIAFVVSDFQYVANLHEPVSDPTKILHRVYGTPGRQDQLNFTLEAGVKILDALSEYLDVNYIDTMPKMDQIAIPDFSAGAMENWGLVTYAESAFYYSETTSPRNQKDRIAKIVAHEFAHQWFGNLVSPEWWNYIWLNEGFATVFEFLIPNKVYPEYRALDYFTVQVCQRLMITDSRSTIRPMTFDAHTPNQISALFDSIAYDKSGCVLTMIMHAIGEPVFKAGLTQYLTDRNQKAANSNHLFSALNNAATTAGTIPSVINITSVFGRWSLQRGYPLLQVTFNKTTKEIKLGQEAFLSDLSTDPYELVWTIPYNFITNEELDAGNDNTTTYGWLDDVSKIVTRTAGRNWNTSDWVLFNIKSTGYYRVNYDSDNWNALISHMAIAEDAAKIHFINRAQLLGDAMNIARTNRLSYDIPLNLAKTMMKHETSYFTWTPFISDFNFLEQIMFEQTSYETLLKLAVEAGSTAFNHFTITDQDSDEFYYGTMTRYALINFMCRVGYTKCHEDTTAALIGYLEDATTLSSAYLKPVILQNSLRNADNELFIKVWTLIMQNTSHADRSTFMAGLGLSNSEENIQFLLDSVLVATNSEHSQVVINYSASERTTILTTIASSKLSGFKLVLELLKTEEVKIKAILSNNIGTVISTLASRTSTADTLAKLTTLMTTYGVSAQNVNNYRSTAEQNILWHTLAGADIGQHLEDVFKETPTTPTEPDAANSIIVSTVLVTVALLFTRVMA